MAQQRKRDRDWHPARNGCGCGCGGFFFVLIVGIIISLFNANIGIGVSVRVPFTASNVTIAGSIGQKEKGEDALPAYVRDRVAGNQNLINQTQTITVGPAEGMAVGILGKQPGAPVIDIHIVAR